LKFGFITRSKASSAKNPDTTFDIIAPVGNHVKSPYSGAAILNLAGSGVAEQFEMDERGHSKQGEGRGRVEGEGKRGRE
jgi:hypothetical protein